jgi:GYF domain 2
MYTIIGGDGKEYGPISEADLRKWISEGRLNAQSLAKAESDAEFRPLSTFPELASVLGIAPPTLGQPPPLGRGGEGRETASRKVTVPAIGLIVSSSICIIEAVLNLIQLPSAAEKMQQYESMFQDNPQAEQLMQKIAGLATGPFGYIQVVLQIIIAILILIGAIKMKSLRSYEFAFAAAILSVLPCINPCCGWVLSLIFGIWAMVVLAKPDVKSQFS